jgi:hypothetical protein
LSDERGSVVSVLQWWGWFSGGCGAVVWFSGGCGAMLSVLQRWVSFSVHVSMSVDSHVFLFDCLLTGAFGELVSTWSHHHVHTHTHATNRPIHG